jgi:MFS transporter, DHA3 family, tetracycline resistance protein
MSQRVRSRRPAEAVYFVLRSVDGFAFMLMGPIFSVYLIVEADLNPLELVMLGTVLEVTVLLMEVPTGVVADSISRRLSVVIGYTMIGLGFAMMGLVRSFPMLAAAQALWGLGYTFTSGAEVAWIVDEVGEERSARLFLKGKQLENGFALLGIGTSVALATMYLGLPLMVCGGLYLLLSAYLAIAMPEQDFVRRPLQVRTLHRSLAGTMRGAVGQVRRRRVLLLVLAVGFVHGLSTEGFDRLADLHLIRNIGLPSIGGLDRVVWFGIISAVALLSAIGVTEFVKRRMDVTTRRGATFVLASADIGLIVSVAAFGLTGNFAFAVACIWIVGVLREVREPVFDAWINQGLDPRTRATVNSMASQADALGEMAAGPVVGLLGLLRSVQSALVFAGLVRAPSLLLFGRARRLSDEPISIETHEERRKIDEVAG